MTLIKFRPHAMRDLLVYIAIALLIVAIVMLYAEYLAHKGRELEFKNDWFVASATAALVFGYAIKSGWRLRRLYFFWVGWFGLLIAHFSILVPILGRMERVPLLLIGVIGPLELLIVYSVLHFVAERFNSRRI